MDRGTAVSSCKHGLTPELCETCAAWDSAEFNAQLAREKQHKLDTTEKERDRLAAENAALRSELAAGAKVTAQQCDLARQAEIERDAARADAENWRKLWIQAQDGSAEACKREEVAREDAERLAGALSLVRTLFDRIWNRELWAMEDIEDAIRKCFAALSAHEKETR